MPAGIDPIDNTSPFFQLLSVTVAPVNVVPSSVNTKSDLVICTAAPFSVKLVVYPVLPATASRSSTGASFTGVMLMLMVSTSVNAPSLVVMVNTTLPLAFATGT